MRSSKLSCPFSRSAATRSSRPPAATSLSPHPCVAATPHLSQSATAPHISPLVGRRPLRHISLLAAVLPSTCSPLLLLHSRVLASPHLLFLPTSPRSSLLMAPLPSACFTPVAGRCHLIHDPDSQSRLRCLVSPLHSWRWSLLRSL